MQRQDLTGKVFGRLTVTGPSENHTSHHVMWSCLCSCGVSKIVRGEHLLKGRIVSCNCKRFTQRITHGMNKSRSYRAWDAMLQRCNNPKQVSFRNYGARGITVDERWYKYENFLEDMGDPGKGFELDRIDNNGNYCVNNCRWVTHKENNLNKRTNRYLTLNGDTKHISEWAKITGINVAALSSRLHKLKWSDEKALTTPMVWSKTRGE